MIVKMGEMITDSILKAKLALKMSIPEAYQKQKSEELQREMSRKQSQNIQKESQGSGLTRAPSIKKQKSIIVVDTTHKK